MSLRAVVGLELEVMIELNDFGNPQMRELSLDGVPLGQDASWKIWAQLPASVRHKLYEDASGSADDVGDDDAASDAAREVA